MPDLPTLAVSQAHYDRIVAAFPGDTLAKKAAAYRAWLTNRLIDHVEMVEMAKVDRDVIVMRAQALDEVKASLPPRVDDSGTSGPSEP